MDSGLCCFSVSHSVIKERSQPSFPYNQSCLHVPVPLLLPAHSSILPSTHHGSLAVSPLDVTFMWGSTNPACSIADLFMIAADIETATARVKGTFFIFAVREVDVSGNKWPRFDYGDISKSVKILKHYKTFDFRTITVEYYSFCGMCQMSKKKKKRTYSNDSGTSNS